MSAPTNAKFDYTEKNIPYRTITVWIVGLFATMFLGMFTIWVCYGLGIQKIDPNTVLKRPMNLPPLMVNYGEEYAATKAAATAQISEYAWIDKGAGKVRIPIERAMQLLVQKGLPTREKKK